MFILKSTDVGTMEWVAIQSLGKCFVNNDGLFRRIVYNFKVGPDLKFKCNPEMIVKKGLDSLILQQTMLMSSMVKLNSKITNWVILKLAEVKYLAEQNLILIPKRHSACLDDVTVSQAVNVNLLFNCFYKIYLDEEVQQSEQIVVASQQQTDSLTEIDNVVASILSKLPPVQEPVTIIEVSKEVYQSMYPPMFMEMVMDESWNGHHYNFIPQLPSAMDTG